MEFNIRAGIWEQGIGLDYYRYRTIPLFLDLRKEFFSGPDKLFVYADAGVSFAWVSDNQKSGYIDEKFSNGFYDDFGLGYKRVIAKHSAIILSLGYSYKKLSQTYNQYNFYTDWLPGFGPAISNAKNKLRDEPPEYKNWLGVLINA